MSLLPPRPSAPRSARSRLLAVATTVLALCAALIGVGSPASADAPLPTISLKGGAATVGYTYTATESETGAWPEHTELRYQWFRGDHDGAINSFVPIDGATEQKYTLTDSEHDRTVQVRVQAIDGYNGVVAEKRSASSNFIKWRMTPPTLTGVPHVGQTITATLGKWAPEWWTTLTWRNTGVAIPGADGLTYRTRPADAGKEISLLAYGEYEYPNGVHPIDRYASRMRISWATRSIMRGASRQGVLRLTAIAYAAGAQQSTVRGRVTLYDGSHRVAQSWVPHGRKVFTIKHLRKGVHRFTMTFEANPFFDGSKSVRSFRVG